MWTFDLGVLLEERRQANQTWLEFLRSGSLSMGIYHLRAGQEDPQRPHTEDEVYHIVTGRCKFRAGEEIQEVGPGTILFVERRLEHRFFDITEDLTALVFFAPPEGSRKGA